MLSFIAVLLCFLSIGVLSISIIGVELKTQINFDVLSK